MIDGDHYVSEKLPQIAPDELIRRLKRLPGVWTIEGRKHTKVYRPVAGQTLVTQIPRHKKPLKKGLLREILRNLDLTTAELREL